MPSMGLPGFKPGREKLGGVVVLLKENFLLPCSTVFAHPLQDWVYLLSLLPTPWKLKPTWAGFCPALPLCQVNGGSRQCGTAQQLRGQGNNALYHVQLGEQPISRAPGLACCWLTFPLAWLCVEVTLVNGRHTWWTWPGTGEKTKKMSNPARCPC